MYDFLALPTRFLLKYTVLENYMQGYSPKIQIVFGGYQAARKALTTMDPDAVVNLVKDSELRGRGGAGFPCGLKWTFLPKDRKETLMCINADESEPATFNNRYLMEKDPHQLIEGILIACFATRATTAYLYLRFEYIHAYKILEEAIAEARAAGEEMKRLAKEKRDAQIRAAELKAKRDYEIRIGGVKSVCTGDAICRETKGKIIGQGKITRKAVAYMNEAFDVGTLTVGSGKSSRVLHVMNEYMAVESGDGKRLAGYPDVITTLSPAGVPMSVGELKRGDEVVILRIAKELIPLSSSVTDPSCYPVVEKALGINLTDYALHG